MKRFTISMMIFIGTSLTVVQHLAGESTPSGDFDGNSIVDFADFILFAQAFGSNQSHFDLDDSGSVDFPDFILFAKRFGESMPEVDITITLPREIELHMVWIQPGRFLMGSPVSEPGRNEDEGPRHEVTLTRGFYLGRYEVTQSQWESLVNTRPWLVGSTSEVAGRENFPANRMRWHEVQTFFQRLNELEGTDVYRLPTEAEWEYACRAGTTTPWSFGADSSRIADYARYNENSRSAVVLDDGRTVYGSPEAKETGGGFPNRWGLYDMHGNVRELVQDYYGPYSDESQIDPRGPDGPVGRRLPQYSHVERGGSSFDRPSGTRSAARTLGWIPNAFTGFRVLKEHR